MSVFLPWLFKCRVCCIFTCIQSSTAPPYWHQMCFLTDFWHNSKASALLCSLVSCYICLICVVFHYIPLISALLWYCMLFHSALIFISLQCSAFQPCTVFFYQPCLILCCRRREINSPNNLQRRKFLWSKFGCGIFLICSMCVTP